jgi:hypothetical protein
MYWREKKDVMNPAADTPLMVIVTDPVVEKKDGGMTSPHRIQLYSGLELIAFVSKTFSSANGSIID